jgi:protein-S-isoprenylcysteine O-methyltransferase Ste14
MNGDDDLWRTRFIVVNLVRIGGTFVVLLALGIWYTNLLVPGGSIEVGLPLALAGLAASFWGPIALSRHWKRKDGR